MSREDAERRLETLTEGLAVLVGEEFEGGCIMPVPADIAEILEAIQKRRAEKRKRELASAAAKLTPD